MYASNMRAPLEHVSVERAATILRHQRNDLLADYQRARGARWKNIYCIRAGVLC